jgi:N-acyl-D-amino-acid deacylase
MQDFDLIFRGGQVLDGTGAQAFLGDVAISGGSIAAVGDLRTARAAQTLDAVGMVVAPGFIDLHSHSDFTILVNPAAESKVRQGVTLEVNGQCGFTPFPVRGGDHAQLDGLCPFITERPRWDWGSVAEYLTRLRSARPNINVAQMVGHSALRALVMGFENRPATEEEVAAICEATAQALDEGACGVSFGLAYPLGCFAQTEEIEAVAQVAARRGKLVSVHLRSEGERLCESLQEMLDVARRVSDEVAPLRLQIDHLKASGRRWWGKVGAALELLEAAAEEGLQVGFDAYPYTAGSRHLSGSLPPWMHDGGTGALLQRLREPDVRARLREMHEAWRVGSCGQSPFELDFEAIVITDVATDANRWTVGLTLAAVAERRSQDPLDATLDLLWEEGGHVSVVVFSMSEEDMRRCLSHPLGCVASDGLVFAPYGPLSRGKPHPRCYGTFPRAVGRYARDERLMPVAEAVRKCTSLPASRLGLKDRGILREGACADLVVFDPNALLDLATYEEPHQYPAGIAWVVVNGRIAVDHQANRNPGAGQVLAL